MLTLKPGVSLKGLQNQTVLAMVIAEKVYKEYGYDTVVTSVNDGKHMEGSLHYQGRAFDLRTRHLTETDKEIITKRLKGELGLEFDVVLEKDHCHIEWDPKGE